MDLYSLFIVKMNEHSQNVEGYSRCLVPMARSEVRSQVRGQCSVRPSQCVQCPANAVTRVFNLPIFFPIAACSTDFSLH